jgi:glycosyltransferase involved in cell wall biosynthesis
MKYSIIIPTLNEEKLLPNILQQIKENNILNNFDAELIISDGGSKDGTIDIALQYSDKVIVHRESCPQNIGEGRNAGTRAAEGDVYVFLGADVVIPDIENFFNYIDKYFIPSKHAAMTCKVEIAPHERKLSDVVFHSILNLYFHSLNIFMVGMGRGECQIIRKEIFEKAGGYKKELVAGEDFEFFTRVRRLGSIHFANKIKLYESPRRYRKVGYLNVCLSWFINSYYVLFKKRSLNKEWEQIR